MAKKLNLAAVVTNPDRLQKWLDNPGLRAKLGDKYLTPEQRRMRAQRDYMNSEVFPGVGMTNRDVARQGNQAEELMYGDQRRQMEDQAYAAQLKQQQDQAWYQGYLNQVQKAQQTYSDLSGSLARANSGYAGGGVPTTLNGVSGPEQTAAAGVRGTLASIARQRADTEAMATTGLMGNMVNVVGAQSGAASRANASNLRNILQRQGDLTKQSKLYNQTQRDKARSNAMDSYLTNQTLGIKQNTLAETIRNNQTNNDLREQEINASGKDPSKGRVASTALQERAQDQITKALRYAKTWHNNGKNAGSIRAALQDGVKSQPKYDPVTKERVIGKDGTQEMTGSVPSFKSLYADIAIDIAVNGGISPANVRRLRALGINVGNLGYPTLTQLRRSGNRSGFTGSA